MKFFQDYWFLWVALALIIVVGLVLYRHRGWAEKSALSSAMGTLSNNEYAVIDNLGLPSDKGVTTIERTIVSVFGIFVVETLDFKGRINGEEDEPIWTNIDFGNETTFDNPVMRNEAALGVLSQTLAEYPEVPFISLVAFPSRDTLNVKSTVHVTDISKVMDIIRSYDKQILTISDARGMAFALRAIDVNNAADDVVLSDMI